MKSKLIKTIQDLPGIVSVEPFHTSPDEPDELCCIITFEAENLRLSPDEVALRNYNATVRRGLINDKTTLWDFTDKIEEENNELFHTCDNGSFDPKELADIVIVCESMAIHYGIDLQKEKELKMLINEKRND